MLPVLVRFPDWIPLVGGEAVTSFGALLLVAFLAAGALFVARLRERDPDAPGWELVVAAAVGGILGAKLVHLAVSGALGLPSGGLGRAGLDGLGGLMGGGVAVGWYARRLGLDVGAVAGVAAAPLALGWAIGRVGSLLVGADYGLPTALPWGMAFPAGTPPTTPVNLVAVFGATIPDGAWAGDFVRVHPTQLYEALLALAIFVLLERARTGAWGRNDSRMRGWPLFGLYLVLTGTARALVEPLRLKVDRLAGPITVDLLLALALVGVGTVLWLGRERWVKPREVA